MALGGAVGVWHEDAIGAAVEVLWTCPDGVFEDVSWAGGVGRRSAALQRIRRCEVEPSHQHLVRIDGRRTSSRTAFPHAGTPPSAIPPSIKP